MQAYFAVVEKEPASDYGVFFPDLPGCVTAGHDFNQALAWAHEALELHLGDVAVADRPRASSLAEIEASDLYGLAKDHVIAVIRVALPGTSSLEAAE